MIVHSIPRPDGIPHPWCAGVTVRVIDGSGARP